MGQVKAGRQAGSPLEVFYTTRKLLLFMLLLLLLLLLVVALPLLLTVLPSCAQFERFFETGQRT